MIAEAEFEYASYRKVHQPQYDTNNNSGQQKSVNAQKMKEANPQASRQKSIVIQEIYNSEETYLKYIGHIDEEFRKQLTRIRSVSAKQIRTLLCDIATVYNTNKMLLNCFREMPIAEAFLKIVPYLKLYSAYAAQFPNSLVVYAELIKKDDFRRGLARLEEKLDGQKLRSVLIMPVQRIPRYILLIEKLMLVCQDEEEMNSLHKVISEMRNISDAMQKCQDTYTNGKKLLEIQDQCNLKKHIFEPGRVFLKQGNLQKMNLLATNKSFDDRMFFLFNDALMCAERKYSVVTKTKYEPSMMLSLRHSNAEYDDRDGSILMTCGEVRMLLTADKFRTIQEWYNSIAAAITEAKENRKTLRKESFNKVMFFDYNFIGRKTIVLRSRFKRRDDNSFRATLAEAPRKRIHEEEDQDPSNIELKKLTFPDKVAIRKFDHMCMLDYSISKENEPKFYNQTPLVHPDGSVDVEDKRPKTQSAAREYLVIKEHKRLTYVKPFSLLPTDDETDEEEEEYRRHLERKAARKKAREARRLRRLLQPPKELDHPVEPNQSIEQDQSIEPIQPIEPDQPTEQAQPQKPIQPLQSVQAVDDDDEDDMFAPRPIRVREEEPLVPPFRHYEVVLPVEREPRVPGEDPKWWRIYESPPAYEESRQPGFFESATSKCSIM